MSTLKEAPHDLVFDIYVPVCRWGLQTLIDTLVLPTLPVVDYRSDIHGIKPTDLEVPGNHLTRFVRAWHRCKGSWLIVHLSFRVGVMWCRRCASPSATRRPPC